MLMPRSCWIDGSATFTTVLSSMIMNSPTATATSVHHLRFSGVNSRARISERLEHAPRPTSGGYPYASRVSDFIWSPTAEDVESANLTRLARKPRRRRLRGPPPHLDRGARALLARPDRGSRPRVLGAVGAGGGHLARRRVGHLVHRREAQPRLELRPQVGGRRARRASRPRSGRARTAHGCR